jgi:predicted GNAT family N-acyltransferase
MTTKPSTTSSAEARPPLLALGRRHVRFGLYGLVAFVGLGIVLEAFHAFKLVSYLGVEFEARRLSFRLAHAHGTLLSLLNVVFGLLCTSAFAPRHAVATRAGALLAAATALLPGGFFLGGWFVHGGDPGLGVVLVPLGGISLFLALLVLALNAGRSDLREIAFGTSEYDATVSLRCRVLREPLGLRPGPEERTEEAGLIHLGAFEGDRLVGCLMLHDLGEQRVRMRQVAIDFDRQRGGLGTKLVHFSEDVAHARGFREMVLHARETAVPFYERLGYAAHGDRFLEVTIPHLEMRKALAPRGG